MSKKQEAWKELTNELLLKYGPKEAEILKTLTEIHKLPSKNESFRRGIVAADYLIDVNRRLLFIGLASTLNQAAESSQRNVENLKEMLEASKTLACEIVAAFAVQKGIESADSIDIFRAELDNYLVLAKSKDGLKKADKYQIERRLSSLSDMATQFAKKEEMSELSEHSEGRTLLVKS